MAQPAYTLAPVAEADVDGAMRLLRKTFFVDEPMNAAIGLCDGSPCTELEEYCSHSMLEGLSFKAVDGDGNIVGLMVSGVCPLKEDDNGNDLASQAERCENPKFQKILYVLAQREAGAKLAEKFPDDKTLVDVKVAATDPGWRRRGIMNALLKETETATENLKIRLLRMDTSSAYSAMSAEHLGFSCVYSAKYTDIKKDGEPLIVPAAPHTEDRVYIKKLF